MTKVYVMESCPDCTQVKAELKDNPEYELIDIGEKSRNLKEFLNLRDTNPAFDVVKARGTIGIPCFVDEDGNVMFANKWRASNRTETVVEPNIPDGASCSLDGTGC